MKILAIGAHPDDIEYGCGGTLLKMKKEHGAEIRFFVASCGIVAGSAEVRKKEQQAAADILGASRVYWGGLPDTEITLCKDLVTQLEKIIGEYGPDVIFVNYPDDTHQDHRNLAEGVMVATRYCRKVLYYEDYTSRKYEPHIFVDIGDVLEQKVELLKCHRSQVERDYPTDLDIVESVHAVANYRGFQAKVKYAESFHALRYLLDKV
ncbi:MAG: PIG-L family deacetylase [Candidatus Omnitrophica bacterium]|nr:PIG-L family deacetylase [Candidatus Omnitrophota bacterium]